MNFSTCQPVCDHFTSLHLARVEHLVEGDHQHAVTRTDAAERVASIARLRLARAETLLTWLNRAIVRDAHSAISSAANHGAPVTAADFDRSPLGRPRLSAHPAIDFNVSHVGSTTILALVTARLDGPWSNHRHRLRAGGWIGIDAVRVEEALASTPLADVILTEHERTATGRWMSVQRVAPDDIPSSHPGDAPLMAHVLARKEAVGKLIGWGLSRGLPILPAGLPATTIERPITDGDDPWAKWQSVALPDGSGTGHIASVALGADHLILALALRSAEVPRVRLTDIAASLALRGATDCPRRSAHAFV